MTPPSTAIHLLPVALLLVGCAAGGPASRPNAEAELRATERAWIDAYDDTYDDNDIEAMHRIVALLSPGEPDDPAARQYTEDTTVRLCRDVAVLTGVYVSEGPNGARRSR